MSPRLERAVLGQRILHAVVLALFASVWLLDGAHHALEPHHFCAEHQRVEHGAHAPHACADTSRDDLDHQGSPARGPTSARPAPAGPGHDACGLDLARGGETFSVSHPRPVAWVATPLVRMQHAAWSTTPRGEFSPLSYAPKHSPPAT